MINFNNYKYLTNYNKNKYNLYNINKYKSINNSIKM